MTIGGQTYCSIQTCKMLIKSIKCLPSDGHTCHELVWIHCLLRPGKGVEYCDQFVSLCVCLTVCEHVSGTAGPSSRNLLWRSLVAMAWSSSGSVAICYVLLVLWMTPRLAFLFSGRCFCQLPYVACESFDNSWLGHVVICHTGLVTMESDRIAFV